MAKTTVLIDVNIGAQVPPTTAWMVWAAPFPFDSGNTLVLPAGANVKLINGQGSVEVDGGVWIVTAVAPGFIKTQAWRVPESETPVQFNALVEETDKDLIGFGPTWAARAELAALSVVASVEESEGFADAARGYRDQALEILEAAAATTDAQVASQVDDENSATRASLLLWGSQTFLTEEHGDETYVRVEPGYDIVILAGQSNMSGWSEALTAPTLTDPVNSRIDQWGTHGTLGFKPAAEPLDQYDTPPGIGPGLQFARWYAGSYLETGRKVLLVPVAKGGTTFEGSSTPAGFTWKVGRVDVANLYTNMIARTLAALTAADAVSGTTNKLVGLLWLQGETDGDNNTSGTTYRTDLDALINAARADLSAPDLPVIIGTMVPEYLGTGTRRAIDAVHRSTPLRIPKSDVAIGATGANKGDGNHYSAAGQRLNGRSFFDAYDRICQGLAPTFTSYALTQVNGVAATALTTTSLTIAWAAVTAASSYLIEYRVTSVGGAWATGPTVTGTSSPLTGLTSGVQYDVRVTARNLIGESGTASATVTGTPTPPTPPVAADSFARANSSTALGVADSGQTWNAISGTWGIDSGTAYSVSAVDDTKASLGPVLNANSYVQATVSALNGFGIFLRYQDINNYYLVVEVRGAPTGNGFSLFKKVAGSYTRIADGSAIAASVPGDVLRLEAVGTTINVRRNGAIIQTVVDTAISAGGLAGLRFGLGGSNGGVATRWDDFSAGNL